MTKTKSTTALQDALRRRIQKYLDETGEPRKTLSARLGCTPSTLTMFLKGERNLDLGWMLKATDELNVGLDELRNTAGSPEDWKLRFYQSRLALLKEVHVPSFESVCATIDHLLSLLVPGKGKSELCV